MKRQTVFFLFALVFLFTQCKEHADPVGYYYVSNENYKPAFVFYYDSTWHGNPTFLNDCMGSIPNLSRESRNIIPFYDGLTSVDTMMFTVAHGCGSTYHFEFTPLLCKISVYNPTWLVGTYEFIPTYTEQALISFAVSQLDFGETTPTFNSFEQQPNDVIIEDSYFYLLIKSDRKDIDMFAHLYADEIPDAVFFLADALDALVYDYCKPTYRTAEIPDGDVKVSFERKISEKYLPPLRSLGKQQRVKGGVQRGN